MVTASAELLRLSFEILLLFFLWKKKDYLEVCGSFQSLKTKAARKGGFCFTQFLPLSPPRKYQLLFSLLRQL